MNLDRSCRQSGFTLLELLVVMVIAGGLFSAAMSMFKSTVTGSHDNDMKTRVDEKARSTLDLIVFDLRMLGTGMPLGQADFSAEDADLGDAPLSFLPDSDTERLHFRMNESGKTVLLTAEFNSSENDVYVTSTEDYSPGDTVYLSDAGAGGRDGLRGEVHSVSGDQVTLHGDYLTSTDADFPVGSWMARVSEVVYESPADWSGITRNNGISGPILLASNTRFEVEYLDENEGILDPPLSTDEILQQLAAIKVTVRARSARELISGGAHYIAEFEQTVAMRNLLIQRN